MPTERKVEFIRRLLAAGLKHIEATSFVHPAAVPQLADAADVAAMLPRTARTTFSALVPNERGLLRAVEAGIRRIAVFTAASETFTKKNIRMSIAESLAVFAPLIARARYEGITVRAYLSTCFVCPFEGEIGRDRVRSLVEELLNLGADEVAVSDTMGAAAPSDVYETLAYVLLTVPRERLALHFHDTYGTALANVYAGLELGIETFDASAGGLGGCPFAPGAAGNLATEDLVYMLDRMNIETGVDLHKVVEAAAVIAGVVGRNLPSRQWQRLQATIAKA